MTATIAQVRDEIADVLGTAFAGTWSTSALVGDTINPPVIKVARPAYDPRVVLGGGKRDITFKLTAYTNRAATEQSERALDLLAEIDGTGSLVAAIQNGSAWSVTVDYAQVVNIGETYSVEIAGVDYLACQFDVKVVW